MTIEETLEVLGLRGEFGPFDELAHGRTVLRIRSRGGPAERQRLQLDSDLEDLLGIFEGQGWDNRSGKGRPQDESSMFQLDQGFPDQSLADAELLGQPGLDDLLPAFDAPGEDGVPQETDDA